MLCARMPAGSNRSLNDPLREWLEVELQTPLLTIDGKMDQLLLQIDRCLSSIELFRGMDGNSHNIKPTTPMGQRRLSKGMSCASLASASASVESLHSPKTNSHKVGLFRQATRLMKAIETNPELEKQVLCRASTLNSLMASVESGQKSDKDVSIARGQEVRPIRQTNHVKGSKSPVTLRAWDQELRKPEQGRNFGHHIHEEITPLLPKQEWIEEPKNEDAKSEGGNSEASADSIIRFGAELLTKQQQGAKSKNSVYIERVTNFLDGHDQGKAALVYDAMVPLFISISVVVNLVQSDPSLAMNMALGAVIETTIDVLFLIEILVRFLFAPNKRVFFTNYYNIIDLIALSPLAIRVAIFSGHGGSLAEGEFLRDFLVCFLPVIRLLKLLRRFRQFHLLLTAFKQAFEALPVLIYTMIAMTTVFASFFFLVEPRDNISTWQKAAWFTIVTLTTVGYGDSTPSSTAGLIGATFLMVMGVLYMAMPIGIIGHSFTRVWNDRDRILLIQLARDRMIAWGYGAADIPKIFALFDDDGSGSIELDEFRQMANELQLGLNDAKLEQLFKYLEDGSSGCIEEKELVRQLFPHEYDDVYRQPEGGGLKRSKSRRLSQGHIAG